MGTRIRSNFVGACVAGKFNMSKKFIKEAERRKEVLQYKLEKEKQKEKEAKADIISVCVLGRIKEITESEWNEIYQPLGFGKVMY